MYVVPATAIPESITYLPPIGSSSGGDYMQPDDPVAQTGDTFVSVQYPNNTVATSTTTLPSGFYVVKVNPEDSAIRSSETEGWLINSDESGVGLEVIATSSGDPPVVISGSPPSVEFSALEKSSVERAYAVADYPEQVICVELTSPGTISMCAFLPGSSPQGAIHVEVLGLQTPAGTSLLG
jgi:hypothetical protein